MTSKWSGKAASTERTAIHSTAIVGPAVSLEEGATVGPYCVIEGRVKIGAGSAILSHTVINGTTFIGGNCRIGPHAVVGVDPQHTGYKGKETYLVVEDNVTAREFATLHRATKPGLENATRVGRGSLIMVGAHVAHDCRLGENVTLANAVQLAGHVTVGDRAFIGGGTVIHQFCRVGRLAMIGGGEAMSKDVLPFGAVFKGGHKGYNAVGCRRAALSVETIRALRAAFHEFHAQVSPLKAVQNLRQLDGLCGVPEVREIIEFIESSRRGIQKLNDHSETDAID
jgi:UDP-N-acetylglucosamine acyltransferase